jgi:hypothetical protein
MSDSPLIVKYESFHGTLATWDDLFSEAAEFASQISRDRLITISHSADRSNGVVTVWYWDEPGELP